MSEMKFQSRRKKKPRPTDRPTDRKLNEMERKFNLIRSSLRLVWHWQAKIESVAKKPGWLIFSHVKCDVNAIKWWKICSLNSFDGLRISLRFLSFEFFACLLCFGFFFPWGKYSLFVTHTCTVRAYTHTLIHTYSSRCFWADQNQCVFSERNGLCCGFIVLTLTAASYPYQF